MASADYNQKYAGIVLLQKVPYNDLQHNVNGNQSHLVL